MTLTIAEKKARQKIKNAIYRAAHKEDEKIKPFIRKR